MRRLIRTLPCVVSAGLAAILLVACGPADYLSIRALPLPPTGTVTPWAPVSVQTAASARPTDASLLSGDPCAPPCWQRLEAGVTSASEARLFLENSPLVGAWSVEGEDSGDAVYEWTWAPPTPETADGPNTMVIRAGKLFAITLHPDIPVTLRKVIGIYGAPAGVDLGERRDDPAGETIRLFYPEQGLALDVGEVNVMASETMVCPPPAAPVETAIYLPAGSLDAAVTALYGADDAGAALARLRAWDGAACLPVDE